MSRFRLALCVPAIAFPALLAPTVGAADSRSTGGVASPQVTAAKCADGKAWTCSAGQQLTVAGERLDDATSVVFMGGPGRADDRTGRPSARGSHRVRVRVPSDAVSGPLRVRSASGYVRSSRALRVTRAAGEEASDGAPTTKVFAGSRKPATFRYRVNGPPPEGATVEVVRVRDDRVVARRPLEGPSDETSTVTWNGLVGGLPVPVGSYAFRVSAGSEAVVEPEPGQPREFSVYDHFFPIRGRHDLGQSPTNNFGGGRGHQGQDMFAACGTPLAAVTTGRVTSAGYHSAAGNYFVLKRADGQSYAYMHLRDPALVAEGDKLYTGQRVGYVGDSGRATGCHLHFELWTAPGWYEGGEAIDPLPTLRKWDGWS